MTENEIALAAQNALANYKNDDFADVRPQDRITPRIRLQQLTSPAVGEGKANPGDYLLDTGDILIKRGATTKFVPLMHWMQWVEFNPDLNAPKDKKVIARSVDPVGELAISASKYEEIVNPKGKKVFRVTESYNFVGLCPTIGHFDTLYIISFQRSAHRVGKGLLNKLMSIRQPNGERMPMFTSMFDLGSLYKNEGPEKQYFIPTLDNRTETPQDKWPVLGALVEKLRADKKAMMQRELDREHEEAEAADTAETSAKAEKHF